MTWVGFEIARARLDWLFGKENWDSQTPKHKNNTETFLINVKSKTSEALEEKCLSYQDRI